jgi:hypothetical protein
LKNHDLDRVYKKGHIIYTTFPMDHMFHTLRLSEEDMAIFIIKRAQANLKYTYKIMFTLILIFVRIFQAKV